MTVDDILTLAKAGYTSEQISKMVFDDETPKPEPDPAPNNEADEPEPESPAAASDAAGKEPDGLDPAEVMRELLGLKSAVQKLNVAAMSMPDPEPSETVDSILASIINPYSNKE